MSEIYHIISRGVDKRKIFLDKQDYFRFIHDLFEFNTENRVNTTSYFFNQSNDIARRNISKHKPRKLLVDILAFCLMPNHYHLLLMPKSEKAIPKFMKKLNMGYVKYFNEKYQRKGTLFEGRYKPILINNQSHFLYIPYYIHLNPLDQIAPEWRNKKLNNFKKAWEFLENYRWSSHLDYLGKKNLPSVINKEFLLSVFGGEENYKKDIINWLKDLNISNIKDFILE